MALLGLLVAILGALFSFLALIWPTSKTSFKVEPTTITFDTPQWAGEDLDVVVTVGGQTSTTGTGKFTYAKPVITDILAPITGGNTMTLFGSELGGANNVTLVITSKGSDLADITCVSPTWVSISRPRARTTSKRFPLKRV